MTFIPALKRQRKADLRDRGLVYRVSSRTSRATYTEKPCPEKQNNQTNKQKKISIMSPKKTVSDSGGPGMGMLI